MADAIGITEGSNLQKANQLVDRVSALCIELNIEVKPDMIKFLDLKVISKNVINEAYMSPYPVPRYFDSQNALEDFIYTIFK
jgi:hypothetical protein